MDKKEIIQRKKNIQELEFIRNGIEEILFSDLKDCLELIKKDDSIDNVIDCLIELQYTFEIFLNNLDRKIKGFTKELEKEQEKENNNGKKANK